MWNPQGDGMGRRTGKRYDRSRLLIAAAFSVWSILLVLSGGFAVYAAEEDPVPTEPVNGVPLVIVRVDESEDAISSAQTDDPEHDYGTIADMNESEDHSVRCVGTVQVLVPEGFQGEYGSADVPADALELEYIRGRGNTTWQDSDDKKPYKKSPLPWPSPGSGASGPGTECRSHKSSRVFRGYIASKPGLPENQASESMLLPCL